MFHAMDVDFIALLESDASTGQPADGATDGESAASQLVSQETELGVATAAPAQASCAYRARAKFPQMRGRVGKGRHGGFAERSLLACHMRNSVGGSPVARVYFLRGLGV